VTLADDYEVVGPTYRFEGPPDGPCDPRVPGESTSDALAHVEFSGEFDLGGLRAYPGAPETVARVILAKRELATRTEARSAIVVLDAAGRATLGVVRPVQRYVLGAGLKRAGAINRLVADHLRALGDEWGFTRIRRRGTNTDVTVTLPILERVHPDDGEESVEPGFLVCDGNHRVVQRVWIEEQRMPAVAILEPPPEPYYARPFGSLEWHLVAGNVVRETPDRGGKYVPRTVDLSALSASALARLREKPEHDRYYRYFRDLEKGFGYVGGQAGRGA
jgi:hypothetical protein